MTPDRNSKYWKEHLMSWESSAYFDDGGIPPKFWDKISTIFRGRAMYTRMDIALELVKQHIKNRIILDIGCGSGRFAFLMMEAGAKKVIGIDISPDAIEHANQQLLQSPYHDRIEFKVMDLSLPDNDLPKVDVVTGLGVIEYFDKEILSSLFKRMQTKYFIFAVPDPEVQKRKWIRWNLRRVYLFVNRCPEVYFYTLDEFRKMSAQGGFQDIWIRSYPLFNYVMNFPFEDVTIKNNNVTFEIKR